VISLVYVEAALNFAFGLLWEVAIPVDGRLSGDDGVLSGMPVIHPQSKHRRNFTTSQCNFGIVSDGTLPWTAGCLRVTYDPGAGLSELRRPRDWLLGRQHECQDILPACVDDSG
jgi:hypothetical protein